MATFWTGSAFASDYGNTSSLRIQPGYGVLNRAIERAILAQFDDTDHSVCVAEDDVVVHCGYLECHHLMTRQDFDLPG